MGVRAVHDSVTLAVGDVWVLDVRVTDADGDPGEDTLVYTVTLPDGSTADPASSDVGCGRYRATYTPLTSGRFVARAVGALGAAVFTAYAEAVTAAPGMPTWQDLDPYLGTHSFTDAQLQDAFDAEAAAQRAACKVPAAYPDDLRQAMLRRVACNLVRRRLPLGITSGDADVAQRIPAWDAEVRRFEKPHRRLPTG